MSEIIIYTKDSCPYCDRAKQFLKAKGANYTEIRIDNDTALQNEVMTRSGRRTVPQIFINDKSVGGFDDIVALERAGKLDVLLNATD